MRIAICDDEVSMVQILEEKIKKLLPDAVIDKYLSGDELIASGSKPDILFLDIQMPGITGIEFAHNISKRTLVIFTTAYTEYALDSYEVDAIDYLIKPVDPERFHKEVNKAIAYHSLLLKEEKENIEAGNTE